MAHKIRIEKGVALPDRIKKQHLIGGLPLLQMNVDDSISIKVKTAEEMEKKVRNLRTRVWRFKKKHPNYDFSVVKGIDHIRIYRVENRK
tara:strand:+ start:2831 stop:3097 length:267 start_codon:yes stop_codon:yes gene_type:complete